jgi:hypothetical protein
MMLRRNYYLAVLLLLLPIIANSTHLDLTKEDAGITIENKKITSTIAKLRHGADAFDKCSFKEGETVYTIDHADNPAILTIKGTEAFEVNVNTTLISTNTEDRTPTQYHVILVTNKTEESNSDDSNSSTQSDSVPANNTISNIELTESQTIPENKIKINLGEKAELYGAIKEASSIPVIQIEQADAGITNNGLIEGKGDKQQIAIAISQETTDVINITNNGRIIGDIIEDKPKDQELITQIINKKDITSGLIRVKKITNNENAELNIEILQTAELEKSGEIKEDNGTIVENSGTCNIKSIDFSKNNLKITNKDNGYINITDRIRKQSSKHSVDITNNAGATTRIFEGSTVKDLTNSGTLQLVLYQAKQRNAILLDVTGKYANSGTIEIDATAGGLKVPGLLTDVPVLKITKGAQEAQEAQDTENVNLKNTSIKSINDLIEISNVDTHPNDTTLLLCDIRVKPVSEVYTKLEDGFSAVDATLADTLILPNASTEKLVTVLEPKYGKILDHNNLTDPIALKKYLTEVRPDDINSIAFSLQHADSLTLSRVKQRLEHQRKKRRKVIYWNKKRKYNFWIEAAYNQYKGEEDNLRSTLASSAKLRGIVIGVDSKIFNDRASIGMLTSYTKTNLSYTRTQQLSGHSYATGLYGSYLWSRLYLDAMIIASKAKHGNSRMEKEATLFGTLASKNLAANLILGANLNIQKFDIDPKIGIQLDYINLGAYKLENTDASIIETHTKANFMRIDGILGVKLSKRFDYKRAKIYPSLGITGIFELKNPEVAHTAILAEYKYDTLAKLGMKRYIELEAGVYLNYHNFIFEVNYSHSTAIGYKSDQLQVGVRFNM